MNCFGRDVYLTLQQVPPCVYLKLWGTFCPQESRRQTVEHAFFFFPCIKGSFWHRADVVSHRFGVAKQVLRGPLYLLWDTRYAISVTRWENRSKSTLAWREKSPHDTKNCPCRENMKNWKNIICYDSKTNNYLRAVDLKIYFSIYIASNMYDTIIIRSNMQSVCKSVTDSVCDILNKHSSVLCKTDWPCKSFHGLRSSDRAKNKLRNKNDETCYSALLGNTWYNMV